VETNDILELQDFREEIHLAAHFALACPGYRAA
jgi:hypothetical protein